MLRACDNCKLNTSFSFCIPVRQSRWTSPRSNFFEICLFSHQPLKSMCTGQDSQKKTCLGRLYGEGFVFLLGFTTGEIISKRPSSMCDWNSFLYAYTRASWRRHMRKPPVSFIASCLTVVFGNQVYVQASAYGVRILFSLHQALVKEKMVRLGAVRSVRSQIKWWGWPCFLLKIMKTIGKNSVL